MGIEDTLPEDVDASSGRSPKQDSKPDDDEYVSIGKEPNRKRFHEDKWEDIKRYINHNTKYTVGEVKSLPNKERFETLHEVALAVEDEEEEVSDEIKPSETCFVCGSSTKGHSVKLEGKTVCVSHPAGEVRSELDDE